MEDHPTTIETLLEKAENYTRTSIELAKLNAIDKGADILSSAASVLVISIVVGIFLMLVNLGLAIFIGQLLGELSYGFFIIAGFYLVVLFIVFLSKDQLIKIPISNRIITAILNKKVRS